MVYSIDKKVMEKLVSEIDYTTFYGASQTWYPTFMQRVSGCGPTTASTLFAAINDDIIVKSKAQWLVVMQDIWDYVTPGLKGLNKVEVFTNGCNKFFSEKALPYHCSQLNFSEKLSTPLNEITHFIAESLQQNQPVAFLNLCNGQIKELDSWHWVTIVQLKVVDNQAWVTIFDGTKSFEMDLSLWRQMTRNRGGFACFKKALENL